ncbi:MAG: SusC/RagA family TonB-linked outer membrane protein [Bacteroidia bacterium]|nr:SusC/RagA family TonB-linked outer membrane protein [Bacteroidia bacterium]
MKKLKILLVLILLCSWQFLLAQKTITGTVTDAKDGSTIPGVNILIKGSTTGAITDPGGKYSIRATDQQTLLFKFVGYATKEVLVGNQSTINVALEASLEQLDEVVITGLGIKRDKRSLGYAVQKMESKDIVIAAPVDISQGLMGKVAGLNVTTSNGLNNASSRIVIRGNNSLFGNNQPVIVVDGAILDNKSLAQGNTETSLGGYQDWGNYLSYLNMDNVDQVSVLKGPNAAALYGARGANGVILVTTKKGVASKGIGIDYSYSNTYTNATRFMDVQNEYGGGFAAALWTANPQLPKTKDGIPYVPTLYPSGWNGNPYAVGGTGQESLHNAIPGGYNTWDIFSWFGASSSWGPKLDGTKALWWNGQTLPYSPQPDNRMYMFQQGSEAKHNIAFSSANDFGSIRVSASSTNMTAPVPNVDSKSTNFSLGSNLKISKVLTAEISASYNQTSRLNSPEIGTNNSWSKFMIYGMSREYKPLEKGLYKNADGSQKIFPGSYPHAEYSNNLFWSTYEHNQTLDRDEFLATIKLNAEITPWLNAFIRTSADLIGTQFETKNTVTNPDMVSGGYFAKTISKDKVLNTDIMVTAHKKDLFVNGFDASVSGMYNTYSNKAFGTYGANGSKFAVPGVYSLSNYLNINNTSFGETRYAVESNSLLGMLNVSYNNYLFLDLTGRNDINSTLPKDNNSYFYPSASAAFVFTEAFDLGISQILSFGKLRLAYGKSANATNPYQLDATYNVGTFGGVATNSSPSSIPALNLRFQTSNSFETGLSLGFLQDRINLDLTYYSIKSENQIMAAALPASSGATQVTFNSGILTNKGVEIILNAYPVAAKNFSWSTTLNFAKNTNTVVELAPGVTEQWLGDVFGTLGAVMKVGPGQEYGAIYGTDFLLDKQGRKQIKNIVDPVTKAVVGTQYVMTNEQVIIGNAAPKFTGGFINTLRYKWFSLYALIDFKIGGDIYSVDHATGMGSGLLPETLVERNGGGLPYTYPDNTTANHGVILEGYNVDDQKANDRVVSYMYKYGNMYAGWSHLNRPRSLSVFENSWVKLREVALTFELPQSIVSKTRVFQGLSVSLIGRNLGYIYASLPDHLNPEGINGTGNAQGLQWAAYPTFRTLGFSLRAKF